MGNSFLNLPTPQALVLPEMNLASLELSCAAPTAQGRELSDSVVDTLQRISVGIRQAASPSPRGTKGLGVENTTDQKSCRSGQGQETEAKGERTPREWDLALK